MTPDGDGVNRVMRYLAGLVFVILSGCGQGLVSRSAAGDGLGPNLALVREFVDRFGSRRVEAVVSLFSDDAIIEIRGLAGVIRGRSGVRDLLEYADEAKSRLRMTGFRTAGDTVWADLVETNEWLRITGVNELNYRAAFRVRVDRIEEAVLEIEPESRERLKQRMMSLLLSFLSQDPAATERLMPQGRLSFNRAAAVELLRVLRERFPGR